MHFNLRLLRLTPRNDGRQQRVIARAYPKKMWHNAVMTDYLKISDLRKSVIGNREARAMKQSCFAQNLTVKGITLYFYVLNIIKIELGNYL